MERNELLCRLKAGLTEKRYSHSLEVEKRAIILAELHGENAGKAALAGLLHDCCQSLGKDEQLKIIESRGILLDDFYMAQPQLWHAVAGSIFIEDELEINDGEVISAVRFHTTGRANMTKLEQIVYLADLTSLDRDYPGVGEYRELAEKSLEQCMMNNLRYMISRLAGQKMPVVRETWEAYNYFWSITETKGRKYDFD